MKISKVYVRLVALAGFLAAGLLPMRAQEPREIVRVAMQAELNADLNDHSHWRYRDAESDGTDKVSIVAETGHGSVKRLISRNGRPLSEAEAKVEDERVKTFIHDPAQLAKQKKTGNKTGRMPRSCFGCCRMLSPGRCRAMMGRTSR
ncbi:hypothetical protein [Tunturiibacter gelidiferens]|uniref:hypothetical protein n=1 Tax=Tunturiibacter gelidiferens TaxID=3069689 RepID=UPI003D9B652C